MPPSLTDVNQVYVNLSEITGIHKNSKGPGIKGRWVNQAIEHSLFTSPSPTEIPFTIRREVESV